MAKKAKRQPFKQSRSTKQVAFGYPPRELVRHLQKRLPGFANLPENHQTGYVSLLWCNIGTQRYSHAIHDGYFTVYCRILDNVFGRGAFKPLNKRLGLFNVIESYSAEQGITKAYRPSDEAYKLLREYLQSKIQHDQLIDDSGKNMRKGSAILSRDVSGNTAKRGSALALAVPINVSALNDGIEALSMIKDGEDVIPKNAMQSYICQQALSVPLDNMGGLVPAADRLRLWVSEAYRIQSYL